ncbi:hypothetical protein [Actinobacillus pleuropneumoniae]|uniref:Uncharacterized protein n=1 Tax=Actinobacillus pleuropneumoniae TaxID=715 RepID=A0A448TZN3_ACTPL|nr:hypothetical protein [Actinobacillus pleuropneumoniae]EFL78215.1 hypothetical protein APP2_0637 [Actinobacillus pleuropneumoniae serovar 2 str. 4226]EFM87474.1 hypothetical protein appser2_11030 [Actinobacillus pleuropneumoniae serovar 2 str. S1536]MEE3619476.1 hypothetical protein [Actinobacillus pleuropneumoniae]UKH45833.1 hypothetical protein D1095_05730 [Actinobacillus pleuropneumoniae serovar 2 str. S1536]VEJ17105.1 Uncharacterised protein [Actinobacillus pleuropneumoniae]
MKKLLRNVLLSGMLFIFLPTQVIADDNSVFSRYEQAKLKITYQGEVGNLLQQLAQRLKIGFIVYELDTAHKVSISNKEDTAIKTLIQQLSAQMPDADIRFEKIEDRLFLVASKKQTAPLITHKPIPKQFIGEATFSSDNESGSNDANTQVTHNTPDLTSESARKLKSIIDTVTNQDVIAQYKSKKAPQYQVTSKEKLGLQNIRVTPLGTFLVFNDDIDINTLTLKGTFENSAQHDNLIAISHKDQVAPNRIEVVNREGKKLVLKKSTTKNR